MSPFFEEEHEDVPMLHDHYYCIVIGIGDVYEWPFNAAGTLGVLDAVEHHFGLKISFGLISNTRLTSRISLPAGLEGRPPYRFEEIEEAGCGFVKNELGRVSVARKLSDAVIAVIHEGQ